MSRFSFRRAQCGSLRLELNARSTFRFNARMAPMRANIGVEDGPDRDRLGVPADHDGKGVQRANEGGPAKVVIERGCRPVIT